MKISKEGGRTTIALDDREVQLLRYALERASFVDTPVEEQEAILDFSGRALDQLGPEKRREAS